MNRLTWTCGAAMLVLCGGCGGTVTPVASESAAGSGGAGGSASNLDAGASGGAAGSSGGAGGAAGSAGGKPCGGLTGGTCAANEFCHFPAPGEKTCGGSGAVAFSGVCTPRPTEPCLRPKRCETVCACDQKVYCSVCEANAAGVDAASDWWCGSDGGTTGNCGSRGHQVTCGADEYCDFTYAGINYCGADDAPGVCRPNGADCSSDCPGTCGCDGKFYCNGCQAHSIGGVDDGALCSSEACGQLSDIIAGANYGSGERCTAVVRVGYRSLAALGYAVFCANSGQVDEATARATAQTVLGIPTWWELISGPNPQNEYVFYNRPGDIGGVGVVSVRNGLAVFGGSIVWTGPNQIEYPTSWRSASELGAGCPVIMDVPGFPLVDLTMGAANATDLDAYKATQKVWETALPAGISKGGQALRDGMVLLYPRTEPPDQSGFNPDTAEWIVMINTEWLGG
jgi:hypothetical protein